MLEPGEELDDLRGAVREWCAAHVPKDWREQQRGASHEDLVTFLRWWGGQLREAGLLAPHLPKEWGGGFSIPEQVVIAEELARGGAPRNALFHVALYNVAPTLLHSATSEQRERFMSGILGGDVWCQGFSEPNAGSDLASLRTRAVRDGDNYVVNGQKVWTSWARDADWCMLLVRTDSGVPKHKGLSCLVVDMHSPGIEVRPIKQATGAATFNELFIDEVVVPVEHLIGAENDGWAVAQGTLASERAIVILEMTERLRCNGDRGRGDRGGRMVPGEWRTSPRRQRHTRDARRVLCGRRGAPPPAERDDRRHRPRRGHRGQVRRHQDLLHRVARQAHASGH